MANYYNLTGWKHTGFDYSNRPYNRDVLNGEYFTTSPNYFQMNGIVVKRDDDSGITYIDIQGGVKDYTGEQVNPPNVTGSQPTGGAWYALEEVDYIRLTRTGYPGDPDFIDISGNQKDPWNADKTGHGSLHVAYYFVTGLKPISRTVTRVFLALDYWTTMGGADELEIETGWKVRGPITDAEDSANYYTAAEAIGCIHPLKTVGHTILNKVDAVDCYSIISSATDLTRVSTGDYAMQGLTVTSESGSTYTIPYIPSATNSGNIMLYEPDGSYRQYFLYGIDLFDATADNIKEGISALYSSGQLELQDSYTIPKAFVKNASTANGVYTNLANNVNTITPAISKDISGYPRKADYMFGQSVVYSTATGSQNIQAYSDTTDLTVSIWANLAPTGMPYARFKNIKNHPYAYDQCIQGQTWTKRAITLQGASGSLWSQLSNELALSRQGMEQAKIDLSEKQYKHNRIQEENGRTGQALSFGINAGTAMASGNPMAGAGMAGTAVNMASDFGEWLSLGGQSFSELSDKYSLMLQNASLDYTKTADAISLAQSTTSAPYCNFAPDTSRALFQSNEFGLYLINTDADDRQRLKNYFKRYGYSGLYKKLTWDGIKVKSKVNFIQCEGVLLKHKYYPMRDTMQCAQLLINGIFLWNEKPNAEAFDTQTDA